MNKSILISINPEHAVNILNGKKTLELRKRVPKDFVGWVYMYVTKGKPYLHKNQFGYQVYDGNIKSFINKNDVLNGLVVARWWHDKDEQITLEEINVSWDDISEYKLMTDTLKENEILQKSCLTIPNIEYYWGDGNLYAWHIKNLEIFDKPMTLGEFYKEEYAVMPNGVFPSFQPLTKAPQSYQFVWVRE
jgi:predicted transcriptional regulator